MDKPKILSSKTVFTTDLFTVNESTLIFSPNSKKTYHNAQLQPLTVVFPITKEYELYLVSQYRYLINQQTVEAVTGFVDKSETALHAAKRALKEETGIEAGQWELIRKVELSPSIFRIPTTIFLARDLEMKKSDSEENEDIQIVKAPLSKAVEKIYTCEINTPATIIGILLLDKLRKQKRI